MSNQFPLPEYEFASSNKILLEDTRLGEEEVVYSPVKSLLSRLFVLIPTDLVVAIPAS